MAYEVNIDKEAGSFHCSVCDEKMDGGSFGESSKLFKAHGQKNCHLDEILIPDEYL